MRRAVALMIVGLACSACVSEKPMDRSAIASEIRSVMQAQVRGWNTGNIEQFLQGYQRSDSLRFVSGGEVTYGWQVLLDRYGNRYADKTAMGKLTFSEVDIEVLSGTAALVFGKWQLLRDKDAPWGYFTLLFRKTEAGWRAVHDHTSSAAE